MTLNKFDFLSGKSHTHKIKIKQKKKFNNANNTIYILYMYTTINSTKSDALQIIQL